MSSLFAENDLDKNIFEETPPSRAWIITFADLISLILTFFVMLYSMSTIDIKEWQTVAGSLSNKHYDDSAPVGAGATYTISSISVKRAINLSYLTSVLEQHIKGSPSLSDFKIKLLDDRVILSLPSDIAFAKGTAVIDIKRKEALVDIGLLLANISNQIAVIGYADNETKSSLGHYSSDWELSIARASAIANTLRLAGYSENIIILGHAGKSFSNLTALTEENSFTGRIDIVVWPVKDL